MSRLTNCQSCKRPTSFFAMTREGICEDCVREKGANWREIDAIAEAAAVVVIEERQARGEAIDWLTAPPHLVRQYGDAIQITTGLDIPNRRIDRVIDVISAETALGLNVFRDIANVVRDVVGGRSQTVQNALRVNRQNCLVELRREALFVGADAVIGVDLDYSEFSSSAVSGGMLFTVATGTAVKLSPSEKREGGP